MLRILICRLNVKLSGFENSFDHSRARRQILILISIIYYRSLDTYHY